jgi:hypothetical protein
MNRPRTKTFLFLLAIATGAFALAGTASADPTDGAAPTGWTWDSGAYVSPDGWTLTKGGDLSSPDGWTWDDSGVVQSPLGTTYVNDTTAVPLQLGWTWDGADVALPRGWTWDDSGTVVTPTGWTWDDGAMTPPE